jgi:membrane protease YdiL (CAAX protease family)
MTTERNNPHEPTTGPATPARPVTPLITARPVLTAERPPSPLELPMLTRRAAALDLGLVVLVALLLPGALNLVTVLLVRFTTGQDFGDVPLPHGELLTIDKWFDWALAAGLMAYFLLARRLPGAAFGLRGDQPLLLLGSALVTIAAIYLWLMCTVVLIGAVLRLYPDMLKDVLERTRMIELLPIHDWRRALLLLIPVAAHEEILFRGLLLPYLRRLTGHWWSAVLISSLVFAALHIDQGLAGVFQVLGVSVVLALSFVFTRSLWVVIIAHFAFNFLQFQFMRVIFHVPG